MNCFVHGFPAEGVVCALVLHIIGASEAILVALLFPVAHGTPVPIFKPQVKYTF
jgi:hypothetical protein